MIKEKPSHDVLTTTVIYHADEFGQVKMEQYVQTRLPDGQITLDYSERYETHTERVTHRNVLDAHPEVSAAETQPPEVIEISSVEDEADDESEDSDSQSDATGEEELLTEEEKKGLYVLCAVFYTNYIVSPFLFVYVAVICICVLEGGVLDGA